MYCDNAPGMVFRPPSEADSFILRVTLGCSHNACSFCGMYRDLPFQARPLEEISALINQASRRSPGIRRVFLGDGNALVLKAEQLLEIISLLRTAFPKLSRVTCYGGPRDILNKTPEELAALKQAGLQTIYLGLESGDDETLKAINKGVSAAEMITAGKKVMNSGIKLSAMVILGLGGKNRSHEHAINTARVASAISPTMLSALTLMLHDGTPLRAATDHGDFLPLSLYEILQELRLIVEELDVAKPCIFRSTHASNFLPLAGTLPKDKTALLADIDEVSEFFRDKTAPTYNNTGPF